MRPGRRVLSAAIGATLVTGVALGACRGASPADGDAAATGRVTHSAAPAPTGPAHAAVAPPCRGCTLDAPARRSGAPPRSSRPDPGRSGPAPLLVVLHGNHEDAHDAAARWRDAARARGWAVLGLTCPRERGCTGGKWYAWPETPRWIIAQVDAVAAALPVARARTFLAGWSGGATAIGMHTAAWPARFAGVVIHGGGQPPRDRDACPPGPLPAYLLVGDANPAHPAARRLRAFYAACGVDHAWDLLPGADHAREDAALDAAKATEILAWLEARAAGGAVAAR